MQHLCVLWNSTYSVQTLVTVLYCWPSPTVHDRSHMAGKQLLVLWSRFSSSILLHCCSMSNTVYHRIKKVQLQRRGEENVCTLPQEIVPNRVFNWSMFPFPGIVQFHVLVLSLLSMKNYFTQRTFQTVSQALNSPIWPPMSILYSIFVFNFSLLM